MLKRRLVSSSEKQRAKWDGYGSRNKCLDVVSIGACGTCPCQIFPLPASPSSNCVPVASKSLPVMCSCAARVCRKVGLELCHLLCNDIESCVVRHFLPYNGSSLYFLISCENKRQVLLGSLIWYEESEKTAGQGEFL